MRIDRAGLIDLSLKTLAEQVELASEGVPPPSHGVRLALKVLHMLSAGDRAPFDSFWVQMRNDEARAGNPHSASYCRSSYLKTQLRGVMRAVGIEPTVSTEQPLSNAALRVYPRNRNAKSRV